MAEIRTTPLIDRESWQTDIAVRQGIGSLAMSNLAEPLSIENVPEEQRAFDALTLHITDMVWKDDEAAKSAAGVMAALRQEHNEQLEKPSNPFFMSSEEFAALPDLRTSIMTHPEVRRYISERNLQPGHNRLIEVWPRFLQTYKHGVQKGIDEGYIPEVVASRLESAFALTTTRLVDSPVLNTYDRDTTAFYRNNSDEVGLRYTLAEGADTDSELHDNLVHEYTHKVSGGTFQPITDENFKGKGIAARSRVGFATEIDPDIIKRTGLNEAVTHHVTQAVLHGDFEMIDPDKRGNDDGVYYGYRKVLADFITKAHGLIYTKTLIHGYFEDTGSSGDSEVRKKLISEVVGAYGHGAFNKLEQLFALADAIGKSSYQEVVLNQIHAPEFDKNGNMVKRGYIDTDNLINIYNEYEKIEFA